MTYHPRLARLIAAFLDTQRIPPGSRLSTWLHGESVLAPSGTRDSRMSIANEEVKWAADSRPVHGRGMQDKLPVQEPGQSALSSPVNFSRPLASDSFHEAYGAHVYACPVSPSNVGPGLTEVTLPSSRRHRENRIYKASPTRTRHAKDSRIRWKSIGTFVSGTVLVVILTVYLALATANVIPTLAFHATFIFCIIVTTIIFAHFLIRLCMLTVRAQPRFSRQKAVSCHRRRRCHRRARHPVETLETSRSDLGQMETDASSNYIENAEDTRDLPAPPPAYGWWRGSVRVDPEDLESWPDRNELHQQTRGLVFAGSGQRPPSYTSDEAVEVERPPPLFHTRRVRLRERPVLEV